MERDTLERSPLKGNLPADTSADTSAARERLQAALDGLRKKTR